MAARSLAVHDAPEVADGVAHRNELVLVGRLAAPAEERTLPSGDVLTSWRIVVDRPPVSQARSDGRRLPTVDALDCVTWRRDVRRSVLTWAAGDTVELSGALRRRFWRSDRGPASRTEVEVTRARRLTKSG
jgi:single-strand DNA-binding protein